MNVYEMYLIGSMIILLIIFIVDRIREVRKDKSRGLREKLGEWEKENMTAIIERLEDKLRALEYRVYGLREGQVIASSAACAGINKPDDFIAGKVEGEVKIGEGSENKTENNQFCFRVRIGGTQP